MPGKHSMHLQEHNIVRELEGCYFEQAIGKGILAAQSQGMKCASDETLMFNPGGANDLFVVAALCIWLSTKYNFSNECMAGHDTYSFGQQFSEQAVSASQHIVIQMSARQQLLKQVAGHWQIQAM